MCYLEAVGTDELFLVAKENERLDRAGLKSILVELWTKRGAKLTGSKWSPGAVWKDDAQDRFGYAIGPTTTRGWLAIVESAEYSTSVDAELGRRLAESTTVWVSWSFDHASMYGQKRISKARSNEPVDAVEGRSYERARGCEGWDFLSFRGVRPLKYERFAPSEKTKSDPLPPDPLAELEHALPSAITQLRATKPSTSCAVSAGT